MTKAIVVARGFIVRRLPRSPGLMIDGVRYVEAFDRVPLSLVARLCDRSTNAFAKRAKALGAIRERQAGRDVWVLGVGRAEALLVQYGVLPKKR